MPVSKIAIVYQYTIQLVVQVQMRRLLWTIWEQGQSTSFLLQHVPDVAVSQHPPPAEQGQFVWVVPHVEVLSIAT